MVLPAKIFRLQEYSSLDVIYEKLSSFSNMEEVEGIELRESFNDIKIVGSVLKGFFIYDEMASMNIAGELKDLPIRREIYLSIVDYRGDQYLIVFEKKRRANKIAIKISEILFIKGDMIVEANIPHEILKSLHESTPEATKVIYFDNVDIPNINKLALYGEALADTSLYANYLNHGKIWYVVFQHRDTGYIVGITRNAIIAMFTNISIEDFLDFIIRHILPLTRSY